jgi:hypothetical protein
MENRGRQLWETAVGRRFRATSHLDKRKREKTFHIANEKKSMQPVASSAIHSLG